MRLMIDCSRLRIGGGIQVGLGVIFNAIREPDLKICLISSAELGTQLTKEQRESVDELHIVGETLDKRAIRQARQISKIEKRWGPDLVFAVFGPTFWRSQAISVQGFALPLMLYPDVQKAYLSKKQILKSKAQHWVKRLLLRRNADYFAVETEATGERLGEMLDLPKDRIFTIRNSRSPSFDARWHELGKPASSTAEPFTLFVPASSYPHKNLSIIPHVAAALRARKAPATRFMFTLDQESAAWKQLSELGSSLAVSDMLVTVGSVPNRLMADHYASSHAVLCPSLTECSTAVFPEAFVSERPVLASDRDFARRSCGNAALYFDPHCADSISLAITQVAMNPDLAKSLVREGRKQLLANYPSPEQKWQQQLSMLTEIARRGRP